MTRLILKRIIRPAIQRLRFSGVSVRNGRTVTASGGESMSEGISSGRYIVDVHDTKKITSSTNVELVNQTRFDTRIIKRLCTRILKEMGARTSKRVTVLYSKKKYINGKADLGRYMEMNRITMYIPRRDKIINVRDFYRVFEHEVAHTLGLDHKDMEREMFLCVQDIPNYIRTDFPETLDGSKE